MNKIKKIAKEYRAYLLAGLIAGTGFFGLSVYTSDSDVPGAITIPAPQIQPVADVIAAFRQGGHPVIVPNRQKRLIIGGPTKAHAGESSWAFVRQSATWANGNSTLADNLITALKNAGLLSNSSASIIQTTTTIGGVSYKLKLETNNAGGCATTGCVNLTSSAYPGNKTFKHRFKLWRASDNKDTLEMVFDDVNSPSTGNGVLLNYRLAVLDSTLSNNEDMIVESYIFGAAPNRTQVYSWGAPFWTSGANAATTSDRGRVLLQEMTVGLQGGGTSSGALCVSIVVRTVSQTITGCGTGNFYYSLAYGQKTASNFETTAQSGLYVNALTAGNRTICGFDILKNGQFNGGGFVADNLADGNVIAGYPSASSGVGSYPGVTALFNKNGTDPNTANDHDDMTKTTIDTGITSRITFHPASEAPGF